MSPVSLALVPMLLASDLPDQAYFQNSGKLYKLDLGAYKDSASNFAIGGVLKVTVSELLFRDSAPAAVRWKQDEEWVHLGSKPEFVRDITGRDPSKAVGERVILELEASRALGFVTSTITVGTDRLQTTVQESVFLGVSSKGKVGEITINGATSDLSAQDVQQLLGIVAGKFESDAVSISPAVIDLVSRVENPVAFSRAITGFALATSQSVDTASRPDKAGSHHQDCNFECTFCGIGLASLGLSIVTLVATGCGAIVGCLLWGAGFSLSYAGAGGGCASCLHCTFGGGGGGGTQCPIGCDNAGAAPCPDGCCRGGSPEPAGGCPGGGDDEECDPISDPDGCECSLPTCLPKRSSL